MTNYPQVMTIFKMVLRHMLSAGLGVRVCVGGITYYTSTSAKRPASKLLQENMDMYLVR